MPCSSTERARRNTTPGKLWGPMAWAGISFSPISKRYFQTATTPGSTNLVKSETFHQPDAAFAQARNITWDNSAHGFGGPIQSSFPPYDYPGSENFWNAARRLGLKTVKDPNAGESSGVFRLLHSVDPATQTRSYARSAHYDRVISARPNYHILTNTAVTKVIMSGTTATGVEFITRATGAKTTVKAKREVIIAAGAVHSPQILQLSGIGSSTHLKGLGIKQVVDLPGVGHNLQDHLVLTVTYNCE